MSKNSTKSFVLYMVFACLYIAFRTLSNYFSGTGPVVALTLFVCGWNTFIFITDKEVRARTKDLFTLMWFFMVLGSVVYLSLDVFLSTTIDLRAFVSIVMAFAFIYFAYIVFRLVVENAHLKLGFVETVLGNRVVPERTEKKMKSTKQEKKSKELSNGTLEDKPNQTKPKSDDDNLDEK